MNAVLVDPRSLPEAQARSVGPAAGGATAAIPLVWQVTKGPASRQVSACGHENPPDAAFCGDCGLSLKAEVPCSTCGRTSPAGLKFCHGCGTRLGTQVTAAPFVPAVPLLPTT